MTRKDIKGIFSRILCLILIFSLSFVAPLGTLTTEAAGKVKLNKTKVSLYAMENTTLKLSEKQGKVTWTTSNKKVATVSKSGKISAKKPGKTTVSAKYKNKTYKCKVTVKKPALNYTKVSLYVGDTKDLKVRGVKANKVKWSSDNKNVVTVSSKGRLVAKQKGSAKISAKYGKKTYKCTVTVNKKADTSQPGASATTGGVNAPSNGAGTNNPGNNGGNNDFDDEGDEDNEDDIWGDNIGDDNNNDENYPPYDPPYDPSYGNSQGECTLNENVKAYDMEQLGSYTVTENEETEGTEATYDITLPQSAATDEMEVGSVIALPDEKNDTVVFAKILSKDQQNTDVVLTTCEPQLYEVVQDMDMQVNTPLSADAFEVAYDTKSESYAGKGQIYKGDYNNKYDISKGLTIDLQRINEGLSGTLTIGNGGMATGTVEMHYAPTVHGGLVPVKLENANVEIVIPVEIDNFTVSAAQSKDVYLGSYKMKVPCTLPIPGGCAINLFVLCYLHTEISGSYSISTKVGLDATYNYSGETDTGVFDQNCSFDRDSNQQNGAGGNGNVNGKCGVKASLQIYLGGFLRDAGGGTGIANKRPQEVKFGLCILIVDSCAGIELNLDVRPPVEEKNWPKCSDIVIEPFVEVSINTEKGVGKIIAKINDVLVSGKEIPTEAKLVGRDGLYSFELCHKHFEDGKQTEADICIREKDDCEFVLSDFSYVLYSEYGLDDRIELTGYIGEGDKIYLPGKYISQGESGTQKGKIYQLWYNGCIFNTAETVKKICVGRGLRSFNAVDVSPFEGCKNVEEINVSYWQPVCFDGDGSGMFSGCSNLKTVVFADEYTGRSKFDTSNITNMSSFFSGCSSLQEIDLSPLDTRNVTDMGGMFSGCSSLQEIDLSPLDTRNVTSMSSMFSGCSGLQEIDLSPLDTRNVTNMGSMFSGCSGIQEIDLSPLDTRNVTDMSSMFSGCSGIQELDVSKFNTSKVTNMSSMFSGCSGIQELDVSKFDTSNVTSMSGMFSGCSVIQELDVSKFNTSKVTDMSAMFSGCAALKNIIFIEEETDETQFDTKKVSSMQEMFSGCCALSQLDISCFEPFNASAQMGKMFYCCTNLEHIYISDLWKVDTHYVNYDMFTACYKLPNYTNYGHKHDETALARDISEGGYMELKEK